MSENTDRVDSPHEAVGERAGPDADPSGKSVSPAARRALAEAAERRRQAAETPPMELNGRGGLEPVRFGDWEVKGIASDF